MLSIFSSTKNKDDNKNNAPNNNDVEMSQTEEHTDGAVPKFVEGDYGMETPQEVDDDGPPPACGTRFCSEWRYVGWFGIQEGSKTLDIPASFGPTSWLARAYKLGA